MSAARIRSCVIAVLLGFAVFAGRSSAQEFTLYSGLMTDRDAGEGSYAWKIEYQEAISEHFYFNWSWLNEGHIEGHHRDGHTLQFWARTNVLARRLSLALGAGPYRFYDTAHANSEQGYADVHGWGGRLSAGAAYYSKRRVVVHFELGRIWAPSTSIDTYQGMIGLGYQLQAPETPGPRSTPIPQSELVTRNEIMAAVGQTIVNSYSSEDDIATSLDYRRNLTRYLDLTFTYINEGDPEVIRRNGLATQIWVSRSFFHDRFGLGVGGGVYYGVDQKHDPSPGEAGEGSWAGLVTPTANWFVSPKWAARLKWYRTLTTYDRDTDIFLLGFGYRF